MLYKIIEILNNEEDFSTKEVILLTVCFFILEIAKK